MSARHTLLELFDAALQSVNGRAAVERVLREWKSGDPCALFAVGKAAAGMALGAHEALGQKIEQMLVITKDGHADPRLAQIPVTTILECGHPVPDQRSLAAGEELVRRLSSLPAEAFPIFLVSGGSSSLVECLIEGVGLEELRALTTRGLAAGWDITRLNTERRKISRLKGGGVVRLLGNRAALALFISDVPGDDPGLIGSGLLGGVPGNADAIERVVVANLDLAVGEVALAAQARGLRLDRRADRFDGDAQQVAFEFVEALRRTEADGLVWGGESTVKLPARHGRGGRNMHLALAAARMLRAGEPVSILSAGTDGTDGPTSDAGAMIDGGSIERAEIAGCDVERAFREFDSAIALEGAGDLVHTGPTGTNVGDLLIGIRHSTRTSRGLALPRML